MMQIMNIDELRMITHNYAMKRIPLNQKRPAAVLIPLVPGTDREWNVVLEVRAAAITQGGEVSLPGGRIEPGESGEEAAIRETTEELLIDSARIEVLCPMFQASGPGGREVYSYLGILSEYQGTYSAAEVDHILMVPLRYFYETRPIESDVELVCIAHDNFPRELLTWETGPLFHNIKRNMYFYQTQDHVIWGFTAMILKETAERIYGHEHPAQ